MKLCIKIHCGRAANEQGHWRAQSKNTQSLTARTSAGCAWGTLKTFTVTIFLILLRGQSLLVCFWILGFVNFYIILYYCRKKWKQERVRNSRERGTEHRTFFMLNYNFRAGQMEKHLPTTWPLRVTSPALWVCESLMVIEIHLLVEETSINPLIFR